MHETNGDYKVIISEKAVKMLTNHIQFLTEVSPEAAESLREKIIFAAKSLEKFPERNAMLRDRLFPVTKYRKMIVDKRYLLIYQLTDNVVYIDYILDCRREYRWLL